MNGSDPPDGNLRRWWVLAVILLSPCLAAAMTVGIVDGATWLLGEKWRAIPIGAIAVLNAGLAATGSGFAGLHIRGGLAERVGYAISFAVFGIIVYVFLLSRIWMLPP